MIKILSRYICASFVAAFIFVLDIAASSHASAEQIVKVIVTFPPGGSADIVMRALEPVITQELKQTFVIENRAGAGGNIGMAAVAQAKPDGYTLGIAPAGVMTVNPHLNRNMSFDPLKDLMPITLLAEIPFVLVASQNIPVGNLKEAIALAKTRPGGYAIGYGGNATAMHLISALFLQKANVDMNLISYRGTAPATVDVLAGHVPFAMLDIPASQELIRDGKLKPLGVSSGARTSFLPNVPSLAESGLTDFDSVGWFGLVAPAGTPPEVINRLNAAFVKALKDPAVVEKIRVLGAEPAPTSPDMFAKFIAGESLKWGKLVAETGMKSE